MASGLIEQFSEIEFSFLVLSLDEYETKICEFKNIRKDPVSQKNADLNLGFLKDVRQTLYNHECRLTLNEAKILYDAIDDRRDFINDALDHGFDDVDDQLDALECLRITNSIIRKLKAGFSSVGIDIASHNNGNT